jgi:hypothetical protein
VNVYTKRNSTRNSKQKEKRTKSNRKVKTKENPGEQRQNKKRGETEQEEISSPRFLPSSHLTEVLGEKKRAQTREERRRLQGFSYNYALKVTPGPGPGKHLLGIASLCPHPSHP